MRLRRTVPFISTALARHNEERVILLDRAELPVSSTGNDALMERLVASLDLGSPDRCVPAAEAEQLVGDQYDACLEYVFSHPVWAKMRTHDARRELAAYLLETRHYLAAASFRMAPGVAGSLHLDEVVRLQAEHVVEEADHDQFYENALVAMGCDADLVRRARPMPATVEWIQVMRTVADYGALSAGVCSGLLESTARDTAAVSGWHRMLADSGQLSRSSVDAIFEHVKVDLGLGHGANWRKVLQAAKVVPVSELAAVLNSVTVVAEMIHRWLDSLGSSLAGDAVDVMLGARLSVDAASSVLGGEVDGSPVWPATVLDKLAHGARDVPRGARATIATAFVFGGGIEATGSATGEVASHAAALMSRLAAPVADGVPTGTGHLRKLVESWMAAIDGHRLWSRLSEAPTMPLAFGWQLENWHYIAAIWQHNAPAVAACPDPVVRQHLVQHLTEEFEHEKLFRSGLTAAAAEHYPRLDIPRARPLPTTVAFIGGLRGLAQRDWKAYVLALAYLQLTLRPNAEGLDARHEGFYEQMLGRLPSATTLMSGMRAHDAEDSGLGHADDIELLLETLGARHRIDEDCMAAAALVPQLTWSFLDGIHEHYQCGEAAVMSRIGWHAAG